MSIGIYKITNPKGKIYVGQSIDIEKRFTQYEKLQNIKNQIGLYNSFLKYGVINHKFEIIEECKFEDLNIRERYWQDYYNVLEEGLNCILTNANELPKIFSEETKQKISKARKGIKFSQETKDKISQNKTGTYYLEHNIIYNIIELYKQKYTPIQISNITGVSTPHVINILKNKKIYKLSNHKPSVLQYDLEGNFIKEWDNISSVCTELKLKGKNGDIQSCCEGKQKSFFGFQWIYKNDKINPKINSYKGRSIPIIQYDLEGNFIKEWPSAKEIKNKLKIQVIQNLQNKTKSCGGYIWRYKTIPQQRYKIIQYDLEGNFIKEWESISEITKTLNFPSNMISNCCRGKIKSYQGFGWKYKEK